MSQRGTEIGARAPAHPRCEHNPTPAMNVSTLCLRAPAFVAPTRAQRRQRRPTYSARPSAHRADAGFGECDVEKAMNTCSALADAEARREVGPNCSKKQLDAFHILHFGHLLLSRWEANEQESITLLRLASLDTYVACPLTQCFAKFDCDASRPADAPIPNLLLQCEMAVSCCISFLARIR